MHGNEQFKRKVCFLDSKAFRLLNANYESVCRFGRNLASILVDCPQVNALYLHGQSRSGKTAAAKEAVSLLAGKKFVFDRSHKGIVIINGRRTIIYADFGDNGYASLQRPLLPKPDEMLVVEHPYGIPIWMRTEHRIEINIRVNADASRDVSAVGFNYGMDAVERLKEMYR